MEQLIQIGPCVTVVALTPPPGADAAAADACAVEALVQVFEQIARDLGWQPGSAIRDCRDVAEHLAVMDGGTVAGGMQVVHGEDCPALPYRSVWPDVKVAEPAATAHITILALRPEYRGRAGLFWPLCVELWRRCRTRRVQTILLEATPPTLRLYRRLGWPLEIIGGLRAHWGEDCYLCRMDVGHVADALAAKARRSASYRRLVEQAHRDAAPGADPVLRDGLTMH